MKRSDYNDNGKFDYNRISQIINNHIDEKGHVTSEDLKEAFFGNMYNWAKENMKKGFSHNDAENITLIRQKLVNTGLADKLSDKDFNNLEKILAQMIRIHQRNAV